MLDLYPLNIINGNINPEASVKLLGIDIDDKLTFDSHSPFVEWQVISLMPSLVFKGSWTLRKKKFQLIVLRTQILTSVPLYCISVHQNHK